MLSGQMSATYLCKMTFCKVAPRPVLVRLPQQCYLISFSSHSSLSQLTQPFLLTNADYDRSKMNSHHDQSPRFAHLANLSTIKIQQLDTILASILELPSTQSTYAQIIDGKRTWQSYIDPNTYGFQNETTIVSDHPNPSDRAMQLYEEIRTKFTPQALRLEVKVFLPFFPTSFRADADSDIAGSELPKRAARKP